MTAPSPQEQDPKGGADPKAPGKAKPAPAPVDLLDVVEYPHRDLILGGERRAVGVVVEISDQAVKVVPVSHHSVQVDPSEVTRLSADDADDV